MKKDICELVSGFSFFVRKAATDTLPKNWKLNSRVLYDHELLFVEQRKTKYCYCRPENNTVFRQRATSSYNRTSISISFTTNIRKNALFLSE